MYISRDGGGVGNDESHVSDCQARQLQSEVTGVTLTVQVSSCDVGRPTSS